VAATVCTPSRAALLTGLYAPQTAMYATSNAATSSVPSLNPVFPTWGAALTVLNPAYQGNVWWFGKWHLSNQPGPAPLKSYGFQTRTYPGGPTPPYNHSPDGAANEGTDGGTFSGQSRAQHPDLILLDVMMPGESGFETCTLLKADPSTVDIPIIFLFFARRNGRVPSFSQKRRAGAGTRSSNCRGECFRLRWSHGVTRSTRCNGALCAALRSGGRCTEGLWCKPAANRG
jgi:hypothetical protein